VALLLAFGVYAIRSSARSAGSPWIVPTLSGRTFPAGGRLFLGSLGLAGCATGLAVALAEMG